jgi:hypothetical protein
MPEHLSVEQITSYRERRASPAELLQIDDHISQCAECRERLSSASALRAALQAAGSRLLSGHGSDLSDEPGRSPQVVSKSEHLAYEQLEAYVDEKMSHSARGVAEAHLKACQLCSEELRDLNTFKAELATSRNQTPEPLWSFLVPWLTLRRISLAVATAAVIFLAVEVSRWHQAPPHEVPSVAIPDSKNLPRETLTAIDDLPLDEQSAVREAMTQQIIKSPDMLAELQGKQQTLLGESQETLQFKVLTPVGEVVPDVRPAFQWKPLAGARSYSVAIFDENLNQVLASHSLHATQWTPNRSLKHGQSYFWQVTAELSSGKSVTAPSPPSPEARFRILDQKTADEILNFQKAHPESHITLGILYAQAGVLEDGEKELRLIPQTDTNYPMAQKLLKSIEEIRYRQP